jgi:H+-translocating NAD(P) transhydrogenase subunit alpha
MKIAVGRETAADETRVAASAETVKKLIVLGASVAVESGAGLGAAISDDAYAAAGATIASSADIYDDADVILRVRAPSAGEVAKMKKAALLIGMLAPYQDKELLKNYAAQGISAFAMELVPRITRAQTMDVLSSQANLAGYRAVLEAAHAFTRGFPMMMTAAGTIPPARVFVMGAGVAGLQAIATARRLGAQVSATDVRPAAREQVQSLGATFVMVESEETKAAETSGGYAKEMSEDYRKQQAALVAETIKKQDIVITTALIPGRKAPVLVTADMVRSMKPGSIIVDLAVEQGGNCELSKKGETADVGGVKILGIPNMPGRIATDASALYARNLLSFLTPMVDKDSKSLKINWEDEIVKASLLTRDGAIVHPQFTGA